MPFGSPSPFDRPTAFDDPNFGKLFPENENAKKAAEQERMNAEERLRLDMRNKQMEKMLRWFEDLQSMPTSLQLFNPFSFLK